VIDQLRGRSQATRILSCEYRSRHLAARRTGHRGRKMHGISRSWRRPVGCSSRLRERGPSRTRRPSPTTTHAVNDRHAVPGGSGTRAAVSQLRSPLELSAHRGRRCEAHRTVGLLSVRALRVLQVPIPYAIAPPNRSRAEGLTPELKLQHHRRTCVAHLCSTFRAQPTSSFSATIRRRRCW
jgi:hypothetical protein